VPFSWKCPDCGFVHFYSGNKTTRATTNCSKTKKKIKIWQHIVVVEEPKNLHPPKVEKSVEVGFRFQAEKVSSRSTDSKAFMGLDLKYQKWCLSLETQRHYHYTKFGKVHRGNMKTVKKDLMVRNQELDMVELMKKQKAPLYRDCMNELNEVLKKRNEPRDIG